MTLNVSFVLIIPLGEASFPACMSNSVIILFCVRYFSFVILIMSKMSLNFQADALPVHLVA